MKTLLLLVALLPLSTYAENPSAYDQAEDCANGKCWAKKGPGNESMSVFAGKGGGPNPNLTNGSPKKFKATGKDTPTPEKKESRSGDGESFLSKAWTALKPAVGLLVGAGTGALIGGSMAGLPGALLGAAIGAVVGLLGHMWAASKWPILGPKK